MMTLWTTILWAAVGFASGIGVLRLVNLLVLRYASISPLPAPPVPYVGSWWTLGSGFFMGVLFAALSLATRTSFLAMLAGSFDLVVLQVIFLVDFRAHLILDAVTLPAFVGVLVLTLLLSVTEVNHHWQRSVAGAVIGLAVFGALYGLGWLVTRQEAMGLGDVKLATLSGLMLDANRILPALGVAIVAGGIASAILLILRRRAGGSFIPYGVFIVAGTAVFVLLPLMNP